MMQTQEQPKNLVAKLFPQSTGQWMVVVVITGSILTIGIITYGLSRAKNDSSQASKTIAQPIVVKKVAALGRLEPQGEVIKVAASGSSSRVAQLLVKQGDWVKKGQAIAVLDDRDRLQAELEQAQEQVKITQARLAQVKAGAKTGEIGAQKSTLARYKAQWQGDRTTQKATLNRLEAQIAGDITGQKATIRKLEAEYKNAQTEYDRYQQLSREGAVSASTYENKGLILETKRQELAEATTNLARTQQTGQQQIKEAKAALERTELTGLQQINEATSTLDRVSEVRPVDLQTAQAEVDSARSTVKKAAAELALAFVRSPRDGQILRVHTWEGEVVGNEGIVDLGQTAQMMAVAEIYETDLQRIHLGQNATVTSGAFPGKAIGQVKEIGLQIYKNKVLNTDPTAATDARVVEVKILLDPQSSRKVQGLTNLEVTVEIDAS
jgi:HlyD family secretion protein